MMYRCVSVCLFDWFSLMFRQFRRKVQKSGVDQISSPSNPQWGRNRINTTPIPPHGTRNNI